MRHQLILGGRGGGKEAGSPDDRRGAQYMLRGSSSGERAGGQLCLVGEMGLMALQSPFHSGLQCGEGRVLVSVS